MQSRVLEILLPMRLPMPSALISRPYCTSEKLFEQKILPVICPIIVHDHKLDDSDPIQQAGITTGARIDG